MPDQDINKILIMGLDNCGKTSIILSLKKNTNLLSFFALKPTQGLTVENFEVDERIYNIWDFGGQEKYRNDYIEKWERYSKDIDKIIYVIDVQDKDRYDLSLQYLEHIISLLKKGNGRPEFSIFIHKLDPNIRDLDEYSHKMLSSNLIEKIKRIIPPNLKFQIFETTIFTVFQKTLIL
ncbi:MAG: GTP-binding protein [Candidatus Lokiarchaeota archaeon]|nr:GTP-binding protein [Candidatus Lokiarchaeota archaeon]